MSSLACVGKALFVFGILELLIGAGLVVAGVRQWYHLSRLYFLFQGAWVGVFAIIAGGLALAAGHTSQTSKGCSIAHLVFAVFCGFAFAPALVILSAIEIGPDSNDYYWSDPETCYYPCSWEEFFRNGISGPHGIDGLPFLDPYLNWFNPDKRQRRRVFLSSPSSTTSSSPSRISVSSTSSPKIRPSTTSKVGFTSLSSSRSLSPPTSRSIGKNSTTSSTPLSGKITTRFALSGSTSTTSRPTAYNATNKNNLTSISNPSSRTTRLALSGSSTKQLPLNSTKSPRMSTTSRLSTSSKRITATISLSKSSTKFVSPEKYSSSPHTPNGPWWWNFYSSNTSATSPSRRTTTNRIQSVSSTKSPSVAGAPWWWNFYSSNTSTTSKQTSLSPLNRAATTSRSGYTGGAWWWNFWKPSANSSTTKSRNVSTSKRVSPQQTDTPTKNNSGNASGTSTTANSQMPSQGTPSTISYFDPNSKAVCRYDPCPNTNAWQVEIAELISGVLLAIFAVSSGCLAIAVICSSRQTPIYPLHNGKEARNWYMADPATKYIDQNAYYIPQPQSSSFTTLAAVPPSAATIRPAASTIVVVRTTRTNLNLY